MDKISELQKSIAREAAKFELGIQDTEDPTKGQNQENEEVVASGGQEESPVRDDLENPPSTSNSILTGGHFPISQMWLIPFTLYKQYDVEFLEDIHFDPKTKSIMWRIEKTLRVGT